MTQLPDIEHIRKLPFFFILGRPRSGTTLLRTLLDVHPQVNIPLENSGMIHLYFKYRRVRNWDVNACMELRQDFKNLNFIESWNLDWASMDAVFEKAAGARLSFPEVIKVFYFHYQSEFLKEGFRCLGDKSPLNSLYSRELSRAFPEATYIHLIRDYRANLASMSKHDIFSPSRTGILMQWKKSAEQIRKLAGLHPEKYLQIRYEDLVMDPVNTYEKVCDFLQLSFSAELLDPEYRKKAIRKIYNTPFLNQWHPNLSGRITGSHIHKWESELDAHTVQQADYVAGKTGQGYKYEPRSRQFGISLMLITEPKKLLFHLNEMNRYLYDRLPYRMKRRIRNRKFILSHRLIKLFRKPLGKD
jgi:hypothetical protein